MNDLPSIRGTPTRRGGGDNRERHVRVRVVRMFLMTLGLVMLGASPAAARITSFSPPTTSPLHALNKQATKVLQPLIIFGAVVVALSAITAELTHQKRRRRKATGQVRSRRQRKPARSATPINQSRLKGSPQPVARRSVVPLTATPSASVPTTPQPGHMWGRTPGGSAAERAAELERERAGWAAGNTGEQQVAAELDRLPVGEWWVFHDLPRGPSGTNVDHLVIGVGGVFTLNTKNLSGKVWVGERTVIVAGVKTNFLPAAVSEARNVGQRLSGASTMHVDVWPVLVFVHPITVAAMPPDVATLQRDSLQAWLLSLPAILTPQQAYDIALVADRPAAWM